MPNDMKLNTKRMEVAQHTSARKSEQLSMTPEQLIQNAEHVGTEARRNYIECYFYDLHADFHPTNYHVYFEMFNTIVIRAQVNPGRLLAAEYVPALKAGEQERAFAITKEDDSWIVYDYRWNPHNNSIEKCDFAHFEDALIYCHHLLKGNQ